MKAPPCFCVRVIPTLARAASALASAWFAPVRMRSCVKNCVSLPLTRPLHAFLVNRAAAMILRFRNVFLESSTVCWTQFEHLSRMINLLRWIESTVSVYFDNSFDPTPNWFLIFFNVSTRLYFRKRSTRIENFPFARLWITTGNRNALGLPAGLP